MVGREPRARGDERGQATVPLLARPAVVLAFVAAHERVPVRAPRFVVVAAAITIMRRAVIFPTLARVVAREVRPVVVERGGRAGPLQLPGQHACIGSCRTRRLWRVAVRAGRRLAPVHRGAAVIGPGGAVVRAAAVLPIVLVRRPRPRRHPRRIRRAQRSRRRAPTPCRSSTHRSRSSDPDAAARRRRRAAVVPPTGGRGALTRRLDVAPDAAARVVSRGMRVVAALVRR